jgi:hypothetical protein
VSAITGADDNAVSRRESSVSQPRSLNPGSHR